MSCVKSSIMDIKGFLDWDMYCHPILFRRYHNETFCCYEAKDSYFIQPREDRVPSHYIFSFEVKADFYRLKKEISWQSFAFSLSSTVPGFCRECFRHKSSHSTKKMRERENYCHANFFFHFKKICPRQHSVFWFLTPVHFLEGWIQMILFCYLLVLIVHFGDALPEMDT